MAVEIQHTEYKARAAQWKRARDAADGEDAVHKAGVVYLPKLRDQTAEDYNAYVMRTGFYNATARTISGLIGMLFRKSPKLVIPDGAQEYLKDVDMKGKPFTMFAQDVAEDCLTVGRVGVLVDHAVAPQTEVVVTVAKATELGLRPMMQIYKTESIINWRIDRVNNATVLAMVVLEEMFAFPVGEGKPDEPFSPKSTEFSAVTEKRWRVLDIEPKMKIYRQRIFRKDRNGNDQLVDTIVPLMNGAALPYVPFVIIGPDGVDICAEVPPLMDLINVNMSHYRTTADYEHGCHFTGLPTAWIAGAENLTPEKEAPAYYVGSTRAWVFSNPDTKVGYLEFSGQGLNSLKDNLDRKEGQMAILGARMLAPEKKVAETATTSAIHRTGENSSLASIGISVSLALTKALRIFVKWAGIEAKEDAVEFETNRDFMPITIDAQTLTAIVMAWQQNAISFDTMFDMLQRGDMVESEKTPEEEQKDIAANPPPQAAPAANGPGGKPGQQAQNMPAAA